MFEEWTAWFVVRDRERELERRRLEREAEQAREQAARRRATELPQSDAPGEHPDRKRAA